MKKDFLSFYEVAEIFNKHGFNFDLEKKISKKYLKTKINDLVKERKITPLFYYEGSCQISIRSIDYKSIVSLICNAHSESQKTISNEEIQPILISELNLDFVCGFFEYFYIANADEENSVKSPKFCTLHEFVDNVSQGLLIGEIIRLQRYNVIDSSVDPVTFLDKQRDNFFNLENKISINYLLYDFNYPSYEDMRFKKEEIYKLFDENKVGESLNHNDDFYNEAQQLIDDLQNENKLIKEKNTFLENELNKKMDLGKTVFSLIAIMKDLLLDENVKKISFTTEKGNKINQAGLIQYIHKRYVVKEGLKNLSQSQLNKLFPIINNNFDETLISKLFEEADYEFKQLILEKEELGNF